MMPCRLGTYTNISEELSVSILWKLRIFDSLGLPRRWSHKCRGERWNTYKNLRCVYPERLGPSDLNLRFL